MKFTYNWLKDFVALKLSPEALADKLTAAGLEVTSLENKEGDFVFEVEVTSNRPDLLSVAGIAREAAAITNSKLKIQNAKSQFKIKNSEKENVSLKIEIQDKKDCPLYTARIIQGVKVGPSPDWLRKRLALIGCRSVNNIVDMTNYVLFSWGEPLHAFDLDRLTDGVIIVRRAQNNEKIITIDEEEKILNPDILVIGDRQKPVAIAGIMGGRDTEVTGRTKNILLEAAIFNPIIVRRSRQALGLASESAYRFERGVNPEIVERASLNATGLIQEYTAGRCVLAKSSGRLRIKNKAINLEAATVAGVLGINIPSAKIKKILDSLGLKTKSRGRNNFTVTTSGHRPDVNLEIDLIEELARIFGFEAIPTTLPRVSPQPSISLPGALVSLIKNILVGLGLNEVMTYSLVDKGLLTDFGINQADGIIEILNPLSREQEILRPALLPSLVRCLAYNLNQKQEYVNIFEVARIFIAGPDAPREELNLGIVLAGARSCLLEQGAIKDRAGPLHLKGILETIFQRLGIKDYNFTVGQELAIYVQGEKIGLILELDKGILNRLDIKNKDVFALELSLDKLFTYAQLKKKFMGLPKYPGIRCDISFILKEDISLKDILGSLKEKGQPLLNDIKIVDYYKGQQIPSGYRGLTVSCLYRSDERTLTEAEVSPLHAILCGILTEGFGAKIR